MLLTSGRTVSFINTSGPMFDLANDETLHNIIRDIYEEGGIVAGVCHGPAGFVNVKLSNGEYLVKGKRFTGFANTEEETVGLTEVVPFLLEDAAKKNGAVYEKGADWAVHVVVDGNLITGQNPASATKMAEAVHAALI